MESKKPCIYYLKGNCRNGKNCKFSHDVDVNMKPNIPNTPNNQNFQNNQHGSHDCIHFLKGNCTRGDKCAYFHGYLERLQYDRSINNHNSLVNELIFMDDKKYISSDEDQFFIRQIDNKEEKNDISYKIKEGCKIGKTIFSGNKVIAIVEMNSV